VLRVFLFVFEVILFGFANVIYQFFFLFLGDRMATDILCGVQSTNANNFSVVGCDSEYEVASYVRVDCILDCVGSIVPTKSRTLNTQGSARKENYAKINKAAILFNFCNLIYPRAVSVCVRYTHVSLWHCPVEWWMNTQARRKKRYTFGSSPLRAPSRFIWGNFHSLFVIMMRFKAGRLAANRTKISTQKNLNITCTGKLHAV